MRKRKSLKERFLEKVVKVDSGCWEWVGATTRGGYGHIRVWSEDRWTMRKAHRVSYELFKEPIDPFLLVLHSCDNPTCVNPDHLRQGTHSDNNRDMLDRDRVSRCVRVCKINFKEAEEIRRIYDTGDYTQEEVGKLYGLAGNTVSLIVNNKRWKNDSTL